MYVGGAARRDELQAQRRGHIRDCERTAAVHAGLREQAAAARSVASLAMHSTHERWAAVAKPPSSMARVMVTSDETRAARLGGRSAYRDCLRALFMWRDSTSSHLPACLRAVRSSAGIYVEFEGWRETKFCMSVCTPWPCAENSTVFAPQMY
jgi:hypothetical protein